MTQHHVHFIHINAKGRCANTKGTDQPAVNKISECVCVVNISCSISDIVLLVTDLCNASQFFLQGRTSLKSHFRKALSILLNQKTAPFI